MFRVYDNFQKCWKKDVYMSPDDRLYVLKKGIFGKKMVEISDERYIIHEHIGLIDKDEEPVFVGDYVQAEVADNKIVTGVVAFAHEFASYVILCYDTDEYYMLSESVCERIKIVGNVFDKPQNKE